MLSTVISVLLFASPAAEPAPAQGGTTMPRQMSVPEAPQGEARGVPTDPLFDRQFVATDDPDFILKAVENGRQNVVDARLAAREFNEQRLRDTAASIEKHNANTTKKLTSLARQKGWRLPAENPDRDLTIQSGTPRRNAADFVRNQITFHQTTVAQYRAQLAGEGDAALKREINLALPGFEKNLEKLLEIAPEGVR